MAGMARYRELIAAQGWTPFYREPWINPETGEADDRVLGRRPDWQWRVSTDEYERLRAGTHKAFPWTANEPPGIQETVCGWPIFADPELPPESVVFEARGELAAERMQGAAGR